ncbi:hypothetical protein [Ancylomarina longa]|uniref:Membrane or secreted protein n=1 Tax=Ancylomarina longa TaxID=2487017 RepID=A0A434AYF7_9BACT|nr:hypothetical protein [Ancylomarina longa]RUT79603.1 hypothetical protein DLK05_02620 [Ancylomarina longa]
MFLKILIISVILVAIVVLALGIKMLFDPKAKFTAHSCHLDDKSNNEGGCSHCDLTESCEIDRSEEID